MNEIGNIVATSVVVQTPSYNAAMVELYLINIRLAALVKNTSLTAAD